MIQILISFVSRYGMYDNEFETKENTLLKSVLLTSQLQQVH